MTTEGLTPADLAAVTGNNDGFGNGAWWIILLFLICGWGNGGYNNGGSVKDQYVLSSDFATLQRQLSDGFGAMERKGDGIANGLCDGFYAQNTTMLNGFSGLQNGMTTQGYETRNAVQNVQTQLAQCCCENKSAIADLKYDMAMNSNATQNAISNGFCQTNFNIQQTSNATQIAIDKVGDRIIDYLSTQENSRLRDEISQYRASANSQYIINEINKAPVPAYLTCNPNGALNYGCNCN